MKAYLVKNDGGIPDQKSVAPGVLLVRDWTDHMVAPSEHRYVPGQAGSVISYGGDKSSYSHQIRTKANYALMENGVPVKMIVGEQYFVERTAEEREMIVPESVPKYLLISVLELMGYVDVEGKIESIIALLPEPNRTLADRGWRMESRIRKDNSLVAMIKDGVKDEDENLIRLEKADGTPITTEAMHQAFIQADAMN